MRLTLHLAVLSAIAIGRNSDSSPVTQEALRVLLMFGTIITSALGAVVISKRQAFASAIRCDEAAKSEAGVGERLHLVLWTTLTLFLIFVVDWPAVVRANWGWGQSILVDELMITAPLVVSLATSCLLLMEPASPISREQRRKWLVNHLRFSVALGLVPLLAIAATLDVVRSISPNYLVGPGAMLWVIVPLIVILLAYPQILRILWKLRPLSDGPTLRRLRAFADEQRIGLKQIWVWETGEQVANAAITGVLPNRTSIILSDGLLKQLESRQLLAVFAHELGHAWWHHVPKRVVAALSPMSAIVIVSWVHRFRSTELSTHTGFYLTAVIAIVLFVRYGLGAYCRQLELQADEWAWRRLRRTDVSWTPSAYIQALRKLADDADDQGWLHPSWQQRLTHLNHVANVASTEGGMSLWLDRLDTAFSVMGVTALGILLVGLGS